MTLDFAWLPPEINSARIFAGAGSGPLFVAAAAWDGLASDLQASASSFDSVITGLAGGPWSGPSSLTMAAAAVPYVGWLSAAAAAASGAAAQAQTAAAAFEAALGATVHPAAVAANRTSFMSLVATNFLGQNTPTIFATEFDYVEMWAQDVGAMLGYHAGATGVASAMPAFGLPPVNLSGLGGLASQVASTVSSPASLLGAVSSAGTDLYGGVASVGAAAPGALSELSAVSPLLSVGQMGMYPVSMMMSPMMMLLQSAMTASHAPMAGLADATAGAADATKFVGGAMKPLGGIGGGLGSAMSAGLGNARLVGAMSVPPTWQGSMPTRMVSSAMQGMLPNAAALGQVAGATTGGPMPMPMPMATGAGGGMPGGMMGRGGASPHVTQNRPSVVPRIGVG